MMDSEVSASINKHESTEQKDELQCNITKNQNNQETGETSVPEIEAPLSPILTNSKKSLKRIARRKSRIKLMNKFSQNSLESQESCSSLQSESQMDDKKQIWSTETVLQTPETVTTEQDTVGRQINKDNELEERMKRCLEKQRNKKFCYDIAAKSSVSEKSTSNDAFININFKDLDSSLSINNSINPYKDVDCKNETEFNFKIPETPLSVGKPKKCAKAKIETEMMTNLDSNKDLNIGFETGSGKKINLSEKALKRAAKLFDDIIDMPCEPIISSSINKELEPEIIGNSTVGFKTASGNSLELSETSINKVKTLFDDIYDLSNYNKTEEIHNENRELKLSPNKNEINTETPFKIPTSPDDNKSNQEMSPEKNLFTQITDTQMCLAAENAECLADFMNSQWTPSPKEKSSENQTKSINEKDIMETQEDFDEFSSPESEKLFGNLTVCEDGTLATRNYNEIDKIETSIDKNSDMAAFGSGQKEIVLGENVGFSTASGKNLVISEESLMKAKIFFQDCDNVENIATASENKETKAMLQENLATATVSPKNATKFEEPIMEDSNSKILANITSDDDKNTLLANPSIIDKNLCLDSSKIEDFSLNFATPEDTKTEENKSNQQLLPEQEEKFQESVSASTTLLKSGFLTASGNKIVISEDLLKKARNIYEEGSHEEEMQLDFTAPFTNETVPEESLSEAKNNSETGQICRITEEETNSSDCCGFTWDDSLKSLKIYELYRLSCKYIENNIKKELFCPLSLIFSNIQSSKKYKHKNYKYCFRYRKKSSVTYGINKKKQRKSINSSQESPESSVVTKRKRNLTTEDRKVFSAFIHSPVTRSQTRKSKDNSSINPNISDLEDAFILSVESSSNNKLSQQTSSSTGSFLTTSEINSLNEVFSDETNFDHLNGEHNSSIFLSALESVNNSESIIDLSISKETKVENDSPEDDLNYGFTPGDKIVVQEVVEKMKHIINETEKETNISSNSNNISVQSDKEDIVLVKSLETSENMYDETEKENRNDLNTPKSDLKMGFLTASGKKIATDENLKNTKNIFGDSNMSNNDLNTNFSTSQNERKLDFGQNLTCEESLKISENNCAEQNIKNPENVLVSGFATESGEKGDISEDSLNKETSKIQDCGITEENFDKNLDTPKNTSIGFVTASGKQVAVSEDSLINARNLLEECDITQEGLDKNIDTSKNTSIGFATASGKQVAVSEDSLINARNLLEECDITQEGLDKNIDTSLNASIGFATTSEKKVPISEDSLKTGKSIIIKDCDTTEENCDKNIETFKNVSTFGFTTASGKQVNISEEAIEKVKSMFDDCNDMNNAAASIIVSETSMKKTTSDNRDENSSIGFATTSGKKDSICEDSNTTEENRDKNIETPKNVSTFGFATASGKKVNISEEAIKKAKTMFDDVNNLNNESFTENKQVFEEPRYTLQSSTKSGFLTASGKNVVITEEALNKARNLFQENIDPTEITPNEETKLNCAEASITVSEKSLKKTSPYNRDENTSIGFATASGKKVSISEDSLKKAKKLFEDTSEEKRDKNIETPKNVSTFGFATASGKKVNISEEAIKKAKTMFDDFNDMNNESIAKNEQVIEESRYTLQSSTKSGFSTASGKNVVITEEALDKTRNLFQENIDPTEITPNEETKFSCVEASIIVSEKSMKKTSPYNRDENTSIGFATASGKKVSISEDSLKKAKKLFEDTSEEKRDKNIETPKNVSTFGFATASGKKVNVSEEAIEKVKSMFDDFNDMNNESIAENEQVFEESRYTLQSSTKSGFSTASGKNVVITEEALSKARNLFEVNVEPTEITPNKETKFSSIIVSEKSMKKTTSDNQGVNTPKNNKNVLENIFEQESTSNNASKSKVIQRTKSYSSPQIPTNDSTPVLRNRNLSAKGSKKRSLGVTSCRQIDIPENSLKRAKLVFDDFDSPKKKETNINNNSIQSYSPLANKTNIPVVSTPQNVISRSTPTLNKSLLNTTITMKESNQRKSSENLTPPKMSPLKKLCLENEIMLENSSFVLQERTSGDPKKDLQKELDILKLSMSVIETRMQMLNKQQEIIETDSSEHRRQRPGCLFTQKSNSDNRISLKEAVKNRRPQKITQQISLSMGLDPSLLDITAENSLNLHFHVPWWSNDNLAYPAVIRTEDGAIIVPNQKNFVGVTEIERAFVAMPGVDPILVPRKWVENHYRWIVWKLASMERNYPDWFKNCLTVEHLMNQLKYRYDREIDRAQRPALRKIVECDDTAAKRMVLCVATIIKLAENKHELELTDGWYSIRSMLDVPLNYLVERNVIKVGMKLMTQGAELLNCEGCCPLELPANVRLQIHYNSTRRAAWHVKLGYQPNPGPLRISLRMVAGNGGPVGGVRAYVARVYPITFMERSDEAIIWRNQRAEVRRANQWEAAYANTLESVQMRVQQELEREWEEREKKDKSKRVKIKDVKGVLCGNTLYQFIEDSNDPDSVKELLTPSQISALQDYQSQLNMERQAELTSRLREKLSREKIQPRNVSTVLKLLLVDVQSAHHHRMLSVWRPTETHTQLFKEGIVINIYNVAAKNNGTLSSIPRTQFDVDYDLDTTQFENINRFIIPISQTANSELKPMFGEFDTIGMVVAIDVQPTAQTLWIADENYRFLLIKIREGSGTCCLFDGLTPGKVVAVMNLIYQKPFRSYGQAVANHYTVLSSYPQHAYLQDFMKEFIENLSEYDDVENYLQECQTRVEQFSAPQNLKRSFVLNPLNVNNSEEDNETLSKKLCGIENTQQNKSDSLTLSDEEMALIDTQVM